MKKQQLPVTLDIKLFLELVFKFQTIVTTYLMLIHVQVVIQDIGSTLVLVPHVQLIIVMIVTLKTTVLTVQIIIPMEIQLVGNFQLNVLR